MKKHYIFFLFILFSLGNITFAQEVKELNFKELKPYLNKNTDTVYVVNFWATWCKPCIEELPHFLQTAEELKQEKVKFLFVSLDFASHKTSRLIPFMKKHHVYEEVVLLNDPDGNSWIDLVNKDWSGGIPATIIYKKEDRAFHEGQLSYDELYTKIQSKL
ncbi:TlpA family protein disulfide reductase [Labilibacter marinus]|uniref:TlpA family protein disulfide reductase n=1 Tax=Labilibacter marinus TaxID=1477105 RepID=UPI0008359A99|nr:TlpA family protein disulfide reductase [Labilibacter marinus]